MHAMFYGAFNQPISEQAWNVSSVSQFGVMFYRAIAFDQDIGGWDTSSLNYVRGCSTGPNLLIKISPSGTCFLMLIYPSMFRGAQYL